jgi:GMP synthase (glutamine-hydrolysing)
MVPVPTTPAPVVLVVQHGDDDPPGRLGDWLTDAGCTLRVVRCQAGEPLPATLDDVAGLVVLGGAMGAYDDDQVPWLSATKALLAQAVERGVATWGICLGHQLLAVACGGRVEQAAVPQAGVVTGQPTPAAHSDPVLVGWPADAPTVHWNNDVVVQPPPDAVVLSTSAAGIQTFRVGSNAWGMQFHPEVDPTTVAGWAADDVRAGRLGADQAATRIEEIQAADADVTVAMAELARRWAGRVLEAARTD